MNIASVVVICMLLYALEKIKRVNVVATVLNVSCVSDKESKV